MGVWTNNWKAIRNAALCGAYIDGESILIDKEGAAWPSDDTQYPIPIVSALEMLNGPYGASSQVAPKQLYVRFGTGNTTPAASDHALASELSTADLKELSVVNHLKTADTSTDTVTAVNEVTVQNYTAYDITIAEWGLFAYLARNYGTPRYTDVLLYRSLLDTPVTLHPAEAATLVLTRSVTLTDPTGFAPVS